MNLPLEWMTARRSPATLFNASSAIVCSQYKSFLTMSTYRLYSDWLISQLCHRASRQRNDPFSAQAVNGRNTNFLTGPQAHLFPDMVIVRLYGVLCAILCDTFRDDNQVFIAFGSYNDSGHEVSVSFNV